MQAAATDMGELARRLAEPFEPGEVRFKPQAISGSRAMAVPYIDARLVAERLDEVVGIHGWKDHYTVLPSGEVICALSVRMGDEWITKEDVGGQSEQPDEGDRVKAAFSDALKRAAVKYGIARYLYRLKPQWCDWDAQKRQFARQPTLPGTASPAQQPAQKAEAASERPLAVSPERLKRIEELVYQLNLPRADLEKALKARHVQFPVDLTKQQAEEMISNLEARLPTSPQLTEGGSGPKKAGAGTR